MNTKFKQGHVLSKVFFINHDNKHCPTVLSFTFGLICHTLQHCLNGPYLPRHIFSVKMHLEVSEANSFLHSHWYIYKELRSKRICSQLQNSGFGGRSKFGREVDLRVEISKIVKIYKEKSTAEFFGGPPKINCGTQSPLVFF